MIQTAVFLELFINVVKIFEHIGIKAWSPFKCCIELKQDCNWGAIKKAVETG